MLLSFNTSIDSEVAHFDLFYAENASCGKENRFETLRESLVTFETSMGRS